MKLYLAVFFTVLLIFISVKNVNAQASYVLPYPSEMPGGKLYTLLLVKEKLLQFWYFGNFAQFTYNLDYSDKYLVEAKTLFEYQQYLLGYKALKKSDMYFKDANIFIQAAGIEGKNISEKKHIYVLASQKHIEVLRKLRNEIPSEFVWQPEKGPHSVLELHNAINDSIAVRSRI